MKVILLAPKPPPNGGIASWTMRMLDCKLKNGWEVDIVDEKVIGNRNVFGDNTGLSIVTEIRRTFRIWKDLVRKLRDPGVKVVHSCIPAARNSMLREIGCVVLTKIFKRKFIIHYRCTVPNMVSSNLNLLIFRLLSRMSDAVIVLNTPSMAFTKKNCKTQVYLIPNFIVNSEINRCLNKKASAELKTAVYVGGVIREKGCLEIIEASKYFPEITFKLIGKASAEVERASLDCSNIIFLGEQNKIIVQVELENADVFLFPSYFKGEGFSNSLIEAMAKGLPCIVSDWAANADMIENNGGIVIPINNSKALVSAIEKLYDVKLRQDMMDWNIRKACMYYSEDIITSNYVDLYEKLCKEE